VVAENPVLSVLEGEVVVCEEQNLTIPIIKVKKDLPPYLDRSVINDLISNIPIGKNKIFIQFLFMTGCRVTEAVSVEKQHLDFNERTIKIKWLKNRKWNERVIPLHNELLSVLQYYVDALKYDDRVFCFSRQRAFQICKKYMRVSPHVLRHSFAVNFLRQTTNPMGLVILQRLLGHSNVNTTMKYLRLAPFELQDAVQRIVFS